jgi:hypothetical protein
MKKRVSIPTAVSPGLAPSAKYLEAIENAPYAVAHVKLIDARKIYFQ